VEVVEAQVKTLQWQVALVDQVVVVAVEIAEELFLVDLELLVKVMQVEQEQLLVKVALQEVVVELVRLVQMRVHQIKMQVLVDQV
jgi:hypothetical protein